MNLSTTLFTNLPGFAAPGAESPLIQIKTTEDLVLAVILGLLAMAAGLLLVVTLGLYFSVREWIKPAGEAKPAVEPLTLWQRFAGLVPLKRENELMMEHSYDGIQELDNPTPPWFMLLFYGTIAIGLVYLVVYHVIGDGDVMVQEYTQEVAIAERQREIYLKKVAGSINENTVTVVKDAPAIESGKALFNQYCTACHGESAEGKVGPNLTDEYWLHGGNIKAVFHTIAEGVPEKGMVPWKKQLNPLQIQQVASYILNLKGTNPPNAKEPQGEKNGEAVAAR
ncbi:cbb3-type cytochrome c oxidase N-terminal domain-containing protein [Larkinella soli]|uniref:cbb3-type cytochrome c oxidase N-terminal domain-containing protein n=1 Tax=Larkinella soli TaxID=1770527 RepID=UPI000FFC7CA2|nr:cbb3-type cytochrome c oxidase N-terminal domain-containing protein [Larkinella soli]